MKLIYFFIFKKVLNYNVTKKVINQCNHLIKAGLDVNLFFIGYHEASDLNLGFNWIKKFSEPTIPNGSKIFSKIRYHCELRKILINLIESASSSDIIYMRYPYPLFYMLFPFPIKGRKCKIVNEHNTIEPKEFKLVGSYLPLLIDFFAGSSIRRTSDGIVGVTDEITSYELRRSGNQKISHITIGNGIDVNDIKLHKLPSFTGHELNLLCVASVSRWHGIDRLLKGLAAYCGMTKVVLHIAGDGTELEHLKKEADDLGIGNIMICHGFLTGEELDTLFDQCHVAVGSLGIHRKGLTQTSELKAREYCARGIPYIISADDPDFPSDFPYLLRLPADESPVEIERIVAFTNEVYADPDHPRKIRRYAENNLDWSVKMAMLKNFLETLVDENKHVKSLDNSYDSSKP